MLQTAYFKLFCDIHFLTPFFNSKIFLKMNGLDKTNIIKFSLFLTVVCGFCADCRYQTCKKKKRQRIWTQVRKNESYFWTWTTVTDRIRKYGKLWNVFIEMINLFGYTKQCNCIYYTFKRQCYDSWKFHFRWIFSFSSWISCNITFCFS